MYDFLNDALFPDFRRFTTKDIAPYKKVYEITYVPYADISPANLLVWFDINHTLEISRLDDAIVLRYDNPFDHDEKNYILLEHDVSEQHVRAIYALPGNQHTTRIREQPASLAKSLTKSPTLLLVDNIDSYEYILDNHLLANLKGGRISRLREEVNYFTRNNETISVEHIKSFTPKKKLLLNNIIDGWSLTAQPEPKGQQIPNLERRALTTAIALVDKLQRQVMIVSVGDQPVGLAIYAIYGNTAIIGHVKVDYGFKSAFSYTTHRLAKLLLEQGVEHMNFEQDLGIEGLRHHKTLLRPVKMLTKVDIRPRDLPVRSSDI
jgi:hypothetical protein